jgi:hypothetical protein
MSFGSMPQMDALVHRPSSSFSRGSPMTMNSTSTSAMHRNNQRPKLYHRPASAHCGLSINAIATDTGPHVAKYGRAPEINDHQYFARPAQEADSAETTVSTTAAILAVVEASAILNRGSVARGALKPQRSSGANESGALNASGASAASASVLQRGDAASNFRLLHPIFGDGDGWTRLDVITKYLWRECGNRAAIEREAVIYNHLSASKCNFERMVRILGNDTRYFDVSRAPTRGGRPAPLYRQLHFVVLEPYHCTLAQALLVSERHVRDGGCAVDAPLPAPAVLRFLRDALLQLKDLHAQGVTHNMVHPELITISPAEAGSFDMQRRFARRANEAPANHARRRAAAATGRRSSMSDADTLSVASSRMTGVSGGGGGLGSKSEVSAQEVLSEASSHAPSASTIAAASLSGKRLTDVEAMFSDLPVCAGKLLDLSGATVYDASLLKPLGPFTLDAQRREPDCSPYRVLPDVPQASLDFKTPPEWEHLVAGDDAPPIDASPAHYRAKSIAAGGLSAVAGSAVKAAQRQRHRKSVSTRVVDTDEVCEHHVERLPKILPLPPGDVFLFGSVIASVFQHVLASVAVKGRHGGGGGGGGDDDGDPSFGTRLAGAFGGDCRKMHLAEAALSMARVDAVGHQECHHFVSQATLANPAKRLTVQQCLEHPFLWLPHVTAAFISLLSEFLALPKAKSAASTLSSAVSKRGGRSRGTVAVANGRPPADVAQCSRELLRWSSVVMTSTSVDTAAMAGSRSRGGGARAAGARPAVDLASTIVSPAAAAAAKNLPIMTLGGADAALSWMPHVADWYTELSRTNTAGIRYDYENTVRDQMQFFANGHAHLLQHATEAIAGGDEGEFTTLFVNQRFPGIVMLWMRRLVRTPSDGEKFVAFVEGKRRGVAAEAVVNAMNRFVLERRWEMAETQKVADQESKASFTPFSKRRF